MTNDQQQALSTRPAAVESNGSAEARLREAPTYRVDYDGFVGTKIGAYRTREGREGVVLQQDGTKIVHVYGANRVEPVGGEAKKYEGAPCRNCSDTSQSNCEPERAPSDPTADRREIVARIIDPSVFEPNNLAHEPFYIDLWKRRALAKADAILAALDDK